MNRKRNYWLSVSLISITLINLLQAAFLELYADEAYYYMYSLFPDWGYLDHPPVVGILIYLGSQIFDDELGVRLFFILLTTASYYLLYKWIKPENFKLFWLVVFALFPLHLLGFMALPDVPVFFFTILFFWSFKRFINEENILNIFILALSIVGMLYSKYHGVLIVMIVFVSQPHLMLRKSFYLLTFFSILLYIPHFYWLFQHSFSSVSYHFFERSASAYRINYSLEYLASFIFYNGPLVFILLLWHALSKKNNEVYECALRFSIIGIFAFFLLSSFKGRVEANWTLLAIIPALYLVFNSKLKFDNAYKALAIVSLLLIAVFRIHLIHPLINLKKDRAYEYHGHQEFANKVMQQSKGKTVVANRYHEASLLSFYSKQLVPAININSRKNQFDFWPWVDDFENQNVLMLKRGEAPNGVASIVHPYFGNYYLEEIEQLPVLRYPVISVIEQLQIEEEISIVYTVKAENVVNAIRPLIIRVLLYNDVQHTESLFQLLNKSINQQENLHQKIKWTYHIPPNHLEISILSDSLGIWKSKVIPLE